MCTGVGLGLGEGHVRKECKSVDNDIVVDSGSALGGQPREGHVLNHQTAEQRYWRCW